MPLVRISLVRGKSPDHIRAISDGIQHALVDAFEVPEADKFQMVHQHDAGEFIYDPEYLGIHRTDDLVMIHIVASDWRDLPKKKALYKAITDNLVRNPGLRPEDVLVTLSPNGREDWCFGHGLATYVTEPSA